MHKALENYNLMQSLTPLMIFIIIFFADFYLIWPIFNNHLLPKIKKWKYWQKFTLFFFINTTISIFMTYSAYEIFTYLYEEFIVNGK